MQADQLTSFPLLLPSFYQVLDTLITYPRLKELSLWQVSLHLEARLVNFRMAGSSKGGAQKYTTRPSEVHATREWSLLTHSPGCFLNGCSPISTVSLKLLFFLYPISDSLSCPLWPLFLHLELLSAFLNLSFISNFFQLFSAVQSSVKKHRPWEFSVVVQWIQNSMLSLPGLGSILVGIITLLCFLWHVFKHFMKYLKSSFKIYEQWYKHQSSLSYLNVVFSVSTCCTFPQLALFQLTSCFGDLPI